MVHIDIPPPHIDLGHVDLGHVDLGHVDLGHIDVPSHIDIPSPHIDIVPPHIDIPSPHIDIPSPHIDIPSPHIDIPSPHIDIPPPHIDIHHTDLPPPPHTDVPPPPHVDAAPAHVDVGYNHWWQNWPKTHGYIAKRMLFPTSVAEIAIGVKAAESSMVPLRAVGGGWSFSDASLPGDVASSLASQPATARPSVAMSDSLARFLPLAEGFPADDQPSIASIDANNGWLIGYDEHNVRLLGGARFHVPSLVDRSLLTAPQPQHAYLMNTRSLKSTLQIHLRDILSEEALKATAPGAKQRFYFHVESGITIEELGPLLDAQSPRLQLGASGGDPGSTLAGALSTATHGAEFRSPLLVDRVKAIHMVGPGGQQWWIEGDDSIADIKKLQLVYPGLDRAHIIAGKEPNNDLLPQEWLGAVVVSMGCLGVIYSVVLEVFPISGSQQVTTQTTWFSFLKVVQAQNQALGNLSMSQILAALRDSSDSNHAAVNSGIANAVINGSLSGGLISANRNQYANLAFNPNPAPASSRALAAGDCDCWVVNRQAVPVPFDRQPPAGGGIGDIVSAVFGSLGRAFAIDNNPGNLSTLVIRLAQVYGISHPFHVDIPSPHIDIPPPHIDVASPHIDIPSPHIDVPSPHIDVPSPHIDVPSPHIDVGHVDLHVDFGSPPFHADIPSPHMDIPSPHIDIASPHIDVPSPHIDIPSPHIDIPSPHIDVAPPHIDLGHIDLNPALQGLVEGAANPLAGLLTSILGLAPGASPILKQLLLGGFDLTHLMSIITRIVGAHDTLDVALDALTAPIASAKAVDLAQPFLTGFLAATLGTANNAMVGVATGTSVGSVGFPNSGLLGAGIEIALPLETAFGFMQRQILDKMDPGNPFFGYVSVRICPQTTTLLGMQQWAPSIMIEVVSFGDEWGKQFMSQLQAAALVYIGEGKDAMLHWGLENDQMTSKHLQSIPALQQPPPRGPRRPGPLSKLAAFQHVRSLLFSNNGLNPKGLFAIFDNTFTTRLGLSPRALHTSWSAWAGLSGGILEIAPASNADGRIEIFATGTDGALNHIWQTSAGGPWSGWTGLGGAVSKIAAAVNPDGRIEVFAIGTDKALYHIWQTSAGGGWGPWTGLGGGITELATAVNHDGRIEVFAIGTDKALYHIWQTSPGGGWTGWAGLGGGITKIAAVVNRDGRIEVFAIGTDKALNHIWQTSAGGGWSGWAGLAGGVTEISPVVNSDGRIEVFAIGTDKALYHIWQTSAGGGWSGWAGLGGGIVKIAATRNHDDRLEVFAIGTDGALNHIWQITQGGAWSSWAGLRGGITELATAANADGRIEVFAIGIDKALNHIWQLSLGGG